MTSGISQAQDFEFEVRDALDRDADHKVLLDIVRCYKDRGGTQRETYDALQRIWLGFGFDEDEHDAPNRLRDELEYTMEVVWGFCSSEQRIWESSLTND
jgi:hypothetical protein